MLLCTRKIRDTQCGFKLFTRETALRIFSNIHLLRWAFDIEVIYLAEAMHIPIGEVGECFYSLIPINRVLSDFSIEGWREMERG